MFALSQVHELLESSAGFARQLRSRLCQCAAMQRVEDVLLSRFGTTSPESWPMLPAGAVRRARTRAQARIVVWTALRLGWARAPVLGVRGKAREKFSLHPWTAYRRASEKCH